MRWTVTRFHIFRKDLSRLARQPWRLDIDNSAFIEVWNRGDNDRRITGRPDRPLCRHARGAWHGNAAEDRAPLAFGAPGGARGRGNRVRARHRALDPLASPRQAEKRRARVGAPRKHVPSLHRQHPGAAGNRRLPVRRVLHPQQGHPPRRDHLRLPMRRSVMSEVDMKEVVRGRYAEIARSVRTPGSSCCYDGEAGSCGISANLYADDETGALPQEAVLASLGWEPDGSRRAEG